MSNVLIAYFSCTGHTKEAAETFARASGGTLYEIVPKVPYTEADLDWHNETSRSTLEMKDPAARPALASPVPDLTGYQAIVIGFPIWWHEAPRIIQTFLEQCAPGAKTVIPFATSGESGMGNTNTILRKSCPSAHWILGRRVDPDISDAAAKMYIDSALLEAKGMRPKAGGKVMLQFLKELFARKS